VSKIRVLHYINQFFGGIGGEEKADIAPSLREGKVGPGMAIQGAFRNEAEIVATIICGDSYFNENLEKAQEEILQMVREISPDLFIAGPAFNAGRYGVACATIAAAVKEELGIPAITAMYEENPGVDLFRKQLEIVPTTNSAAGMRNAVKGLVPLALKLARGEELLGPEEEGYFPKGIRVNYFAEKRGSERAVDMLLKKIKGEEFKTEFPMPVFDRVDPAAPLTDLKSATIALVTSGGIVPKGNPDRIEASNASKYGAYSLEGFVDLTEDTHETAHGGYDPVYANRDADRVLPVDVLRKMEANGEIGKLHEMFYTTVGNGTAVASAKAYAADIGQKLLAAGVDAVILTST